MSKGKKESSIEEEFEELSLPKKKRINSKKKGNAAELALSKIFNEKFGNGKFARTVMSGAYLGKSNFTRSSLLTEEQQLAFIGDLITPLNFKFCIESKAYETADFWDLFNESSPINEWFKQTETDSKRAHKKPLIIVKYNNKKRIVYTKEPIENPVFTFKGWNCLWLEDFLNLPNEFFFD